MLFEVVPDREVNSSAPLVFTWTSSVRGACTRAIHFPGVRDGAEGWVAFGESPSQRGVVACQGVSEEERDWVGAPQGCRPVQGVHFSEPVFYGLVDGDQNEATDGDEMVFILMFEHPEATRFVLRDCEHDTRAVEWDWQYVIRTPEAGKTYSQGARMVYKPFLGEEDVLAEYRAWRDAPPAMNGLVADALVAPLSIPGPDREECDPVAPLNHLAEMDPKKAVDAYAALLEIPLYRLAAAEGIDACFMRDSDYSGLAARWEAIAARDTLDALAWSRLGAVSRRMGDTEKAAEAFARGLGKDACDQDCLIGLTAVRFDQGNVREAVETAGAAVGCNPDLARQATDLCAVAARACFAAGDTAAAETACVAALQFMPKDTPSKMLMGRLLVGRGKVEDGLAFFGEVIAADPNMAEPVADACSAIAETCIREGNVPGAATVLRRAIACSSNKPNYRMVLGKALEAARDDDGALAEYLAAMAESPESAAFAACIDMIHERRKDNAARVDVWRHMVDICPNAVTPRTHLSLAMEAVGDLVGAETACQTVLEREPGNGSAKIQLGKLRAIRGDIDGGLALIKEAVSVQPGIAEHAAGACAVAAKVRLEAGDGAGAEAVLRCARSLVPATCQYAVTQAGILESLGDMTGAEAAYHEALKCDPGLVTAKVHLGALLTMRGDGDGGRILIEEAVSSLPTGAGQAAETCDSIHLQPPSLAFSRLIDPKVRASP